MHLRNNSYIKTTRFRITLWYSSFFLLMELLIGVVIYSYLYRNLNNNLDASLKRQAEAIYNLVNERNVDLTGFEPDSIYTSKEDLVYDIIYETLTFNPRNTFVQIQNRNNVLFRTENLRNVDLPNQGTRNRLRLLTFRNARLSDHEIRGAFLSRGDYRIVVAFPSDLMEEPLLLLRNIFIILFPISFLISIAIGAFISAGSLSRINSIIRETEEITAQNLEKTIDGGNFDDEYGRLVRTMNAMIKRIKTSMDYMNHFSISASHELRTPLTILRGEIEVALRSPKTPEQYRSILQSNYEETLRLVNITENLFLISRLENSMITIHTAKTDINGFLEEIASHFTNTTLDTTLQLRLMTGAGVSVNIDPYWLKQAILNLIDNAVKYGSEDSPVILSSYMEGQQTVVISVQNKGNGIPEDVQDKIFDKFFRVESSRNRNTGGAGLGLAVVKSIVAWHDGEIKLKSVPDEYTEFSILIKKA
ncbi:MAG: sensor histidine kinase [Bacteroidota bacterium]